MCLKDLGCMSLNESFVSMFETPAGIVNDRDEDVFVMSAEFKSIVSLFGGVYWIRRVSHTLAVRNTRCSISVETIKQQPVSFV